METIVELSAIRKAIADRMVESKTKAPHAYVTIDISMKNAVDFRVAVNKKADEEGREDKISLNDLLVKACALGLKEFPGINATFVDDKLHLHDEINIGVVAAIDNDEGILVPVLKNADTKPLLELSAEMKEKGALVRKKRLRASDSMNGTFTISNVGMFGAKYLTAVVQPPQVAILGVGSAIPTPVVVNNEIAIAPVMGITLSFDHRAVDGAVAAKFIAKVAEILQEPEKLV